MAPHLCSLGKVFFDLFLTEDVLLYDKSDQDKQSFNDCDKFYDIPYFSPNKANDCLKQNKNDNFSMLHLCIRFLKKNFDSLIIITTQLLI